MDDFLLDREPTNWAPPKGFPTTLKPAGVFVQEAPSGLEVALVRAARKPTVGDLRQGWEKRRAGRASPVLLLAFYPHGEGDRVSLCGPVGEQPVVHHNIELSQAERLVDVALNEPSHHAATRFLLTALPELDSPFPGLRNVGLLATQELRAGVPARPDWVSATRKAQPLLALRGRKLVEKLGFQVHTLATNASMLTINGRKHAVAVFCDEGESFETASRRFDNASPVSQALALADQENVDWVLLTRSSEIRLYSARVNAGVGRKGRTETFVELNLSLLPSESAGYLHLLFSADALNDEGTLTEILDRSADFAAELAVRLRERVYHEAVPALARAVATRLSSDPNRIDLAETDLADAYEQVMVILFRLLFVAYAEDKDLLPYRSNGRYADHSLSLKAQRLTEDRRSGREQYDEWATSLWDDINQLWDAVNSGNSDWGVPAYNGGLFSSDPKISASGAALAGLSLTNAEFGPALAAILIDKSPEGPGPVDFRSLSVREFGTIYEGLLESKLSVAQDDLTVKRIKGKEQYVPASAEETVEVASGEVYFHNRSGVRKATGSYFTKPFAVDHLLDHALEPALDDHIDRLEALRQQGDDAAVAEAFFDFRCADIAMGSAHFLVAAVDRIETRLSAWLTLHPVPTVTAELQRLRSTALEALGDLADGVEIETASLLRRQVARHCIYGVDKNRVAVELARLAIWVHTFVPGLPLSFLDHNLVQGDSITGVASVDEATSAVTPKGSDAGESLFVYQLQSWLDDCKEPLARLGRINDATKSEIEAARAAHSDAREAVAQVEAVFNVATAVRAGDIELHSDFGFTPEEIAELANQPSVSDAVARLIPVHYPTVWPEVFAREGRSGFDCLLGNPPWEKVVVDREVWWGIHLPGVRSLPVAQRRARIDALESARPDLANEFEDEKQSAEALKQVIRATFPHLGSGQTDLYKAFAWANLGLCREGGKIGLVLPRSAVSDAGMANWRTRVVGERERGKREIQPRCGSQWRRSSITRAGCSRGFTTPTPSR
ncbi:MAG: hypothetical protein F4Z58_11540 [Acidimicrobiaceae bacterium]|nr:hypothetical protein [Acidimicrobiaceae bacterium]MYD08264.1 hypothetical protein [Acidimicrobiaceae bacterium]MYI58715.1 hypothetical protein [Acidimicrobiaceae bacterium]